ncbi:hypothetical protein OUZ56_028808 [Daphnia magna]|uniref:Uncharacterized protein n=1 Tax=Daphnia magna TaxID=35525 RepID=A0ABR0B4Z3_9CRUS|nr:hypothetical protein OUZ56_028808 [Daphnia magna]
MNVARYHGSVVTSNAVKCGSIIANVGLFFVAEVDSIFYLSSEIATRESIEATTETPCTTFLQLMAKYLTNLHMVSPRIQAVTWATGDRRHGSVLNWIPRRSDGYAGSAFLL